MCASGGGGDDGHAGGVHFGGVHLDGIGDDKGASGSAVFGGDAQGAWAAGDDEADVGVLEVVCGERGFDGVGELVEGVGDLESDGMGGLEEALEVRVFFEDATVVLSYAFEDAVAVEESVVVDGDGCLRGGDEVAVEPDFSFHEGVRVRKIRCVDD